MNRASGVFRGAAGADIALHKNGAGVGATGKSPRPTALCFVHRHSGQTHARISNMRIIMRALCIASLFSLPPAALAFDNGQYNDVPDNVRSWFKNVRSPHGVPCCDIADGHRTAYDIRSDGYWVPIEGEWRQVPAEAIVHNAGNPVGEAVVWYVRQGESTYYIRCFVPGGGV
jgi:hypothetical protein